VGNYASNVKSIYFFLVSDPGFTFLLAISYLSAVLIALIRETMEITDCLEYIRSRSAYKARISSASTTEQNFKPFPSVLKLYRHSAGTNQANDVDANGL